MSTAETFPPGRHRRPAPLSDQLAWLAARLLDAGAVMATGLTAAVVILAAASLVLAALVSLVGGR